MGNGWVVSAVIGLYYVLPYAVWQWANIGVLRRGSGGRPQVALTFDDGPDPRTTPRVLDALDAAGVKATFFLLGEAALAHPELACRIRERGHEIGCHGHRHRHAALRTPWGVAMDLARGIRALERATGERPRWFRPPHGSYTLASLPAARALGVTPVHWTVEAGDWKRNATPGAVRERVLHALEPGDVVVMHDAGRGGETAAAVLPDLLQDLKKLGYRPVALSALTDLRTGSGSEVVQRLWQVVEHGFDRAIGLEPVSLHADCVYRVSRVRYSGPPLTLSDGSVFQPGEPAGEIHLNSRRVQAVADANPRAVLRLLRRSTQGVARLIRDDPRFQDVRVFFGITSRPELFSIVGLQTHEYEVERRYLGAYMRLLRRIYGARSSQPQSMRPVLVWADRWTLLERFGSED